MIYYLSNGGMGWSQSLFKGQVPNFTVFSSFKQLKNNIQSGIRKIEIQQSKSSSPQINTDLITTYTPEYLYENPRIQLRRCSIQEEYKTKNNCIVRQKGAVSLYLCFPPPPNQHMQFLSWGRETAGSKFNVPSSLMFCRTEMLLSCLTQSTQKIQQSWNASGQLRTRKSGRQFSVASELHRGHCGLQLLADLSSQWGSQQTVRFTAAGTELSSQRRSQQLARLSAAGRDTSSQPGSVVLEEGAQS